RAAARRVGAPRLGGDAGGHRAHARPRRRNARRQAAAARAARRVAARSRRRATRTRARQAYSRSPRSRFAFIGLVSGCRALRRGGDAAPPRPDEQGAAGAVSLVPGVLLPDLDYFQRIISSFHYAIAR